jgi:hypothetical protein
VPKPDYTCRTATRVANFNPKRKDQVARPRSFDLVPIPEELPYEIYSSLMGLLSSGGAYLGLGPN